MFNAYSSSKTKELIRAVTVEPNNVLFKNYNEQYVIMENFSKVLQGITIPIQILCQSDTLNPNDYIYNIKNESYYDFIKEIVEKNNITKKTFKIIIRHHDEDIINNELQIIKNNLSRCSVDIDDEIINLDSYSDQLAYNLNVNYIKNEKYFCKSIFVNDWPNRCSNGWLSDIYNCEKNIDISMFILPMNDKFESLKYLEKKININVSNDIVEESFDSSKFDEKIISAIQMKEDLYKNKGKMFFMGFYITVKSPTLRQLKNDFNYVCSTLKGLGIKASNVNFNEDIAYKTTRPLGIDFIDKKYNFTTESLKHFFPFVSSNVIDESGVLIGNNQLNSSLIFLNPFSYNSALMYILGKVGVGKSYLAKLLALRMAYSGIHVDIWDMNGEYSKLKKIANLPNLNVYNYKSIRQYKFILSDYRLKMEQNSKKLEKRFLIIDELWKYLNSEYGDDFVDGLNHITLEGRKFHQGLCVISQQIEHLYKSSKAASILKNASIKFLMGMEFNEAKAVKKDLNITNNEINLLISAQNNGILFAGNKNIQFKALASELEHKMITTNPQEILNSNRGNMRCLSKMKVL